MAYAGRTAIVVPKPLVPYVGLDVLELGIIFACGFQLDRFLICSNYLFWNIF